MKDFCVVMAMAIVLASSCMKEGIGAGVPVVEQLQTVPMAGVSVSPLNLDLYIGQTKQLTPSFRPRNATNKDVRWTCSAGGVIALDQKGNVRGVHPGYATVVVHTVDGDYQATCYVRVTKNDVDSIAISHPKGILLTKGETFDLSARALGADRSAEPSFPSLVWSSGTQGVACVDASTGRVTALSGGTAVISATSVDDTSKVACCKVTVLDVGPACEGGIGFKNWDF